MFPIQYQPTGYFYGSKHNVNMGATTKQDKKAGVQFWQER